MTTLQMDTSTRVVQSTVSRCLQQFTRALNQRADQIIKFPPSKRDVRDTISDFRNIAGKVFCGFDIHIEE